jgi:hypothetical protein
MIASRLLRPLLLSAAIFSSAAGAVGLGEISVHSHIGEALRADVPVLSAGEPLDAACFSLGSVPDAELPVISAARMRLVRIGQDYRLIMTGSRAINEPAVIISLRAGCGIDLQREYVLLPAPPPGTNEIDLPSALETINPREVFPGQTRAERLGTGRAEDNYFPEKAVEKRRKAVSKSAASNQNRPPRDTLARIDKGKDRIILGAALDSLPPTAAGDPLAPLDSLDERILKMETTLHLLSQEVDKLSSAASLAAEARAMREKLQGMDARQADQTPVPKAEAALPQRPPRNESSHSDWLQLLLGVLLGGSVSAGVAHLVSRKRDGERAFDAPLRMARPGKSNHQATA